MPLIKVCKLSALGDTRSLGFYITEVTPERNIFIVSGDDQVYAYENRCPHTQAPLDWSPHKSSVALKIIFNAPITVPYSRLVVVVVSTAHGSTSL